MKTKNFIFLLPLFGLLLSSCGEAKRKITLSSWWFDEGKIATQMNKESQKAGSYWVIRVDFSTLDETSDATVLPNMFKGDNALATCFIDGYIASTTISLTATKITTSYFMSGIPSGSSDDILVAFETEVGNETKFSFNGIALEPGNLIDVNI